jgi:hypothetical protein
MPRFGALRERSRLEAFRGAVDEHYRYHQFYGSTALAVFVFYAGWSIHYRLTTSLPSFLVSALVWVGVEGLLFFAAIDTYGKYVRRINEILSN